VAIEINCTECGAEISGREEIYCQSCNNGLQKRIEFLEGELQEEKAKNTDLQREIAYLESEGARSV